MSVLIEGIVIGFGIVLGILIAQLLCWLFFKGVDVIFDLMDHW